jgi:hypothetical protein
MAAPTPYHRHHQIGIKSFDTAVPTGLVGGPASVRYGQQINISCDRSVPKNNPVLSKSFLPPHPDG